MYTTVATKSFEVEEYSLSDGYYEIIVRSRNDGIVDVFTRPTMREARMAFLGAGYNMGPHYRP